MRSPSAPRDCGPCTLCCKVMAVDEIEKVAGAWCAHCAKGAGCAIYETRPQSCRAFSCAWLRHPQLPRNLRPDLTRVVLAFDNNATRLIASCDPAHPMAWRREPIYGYLKRWAEGSWATGGQVVAWPARDKKQTHQTSPTTRESRARTRASGSCGAWTAASRRRER